MTYPDLNLGPVGHLHHWAITTPDALALVAPRRRLTWKQLLSEVQSVVQMLRDLNLSGGTLLDFRLDTEIVFTLACLHEGILCAGIPERIDLKAIRQAGFENVLTVDGVIELKGLRQVKVPTYAAFDKPIDGFGYHEFKDDELMRVVFSSGSTGPSKPIAFTKQAMLARIAKVSETYLATTPFMSLTSVRSSLGNNAFLTSLWQGSPHIVASNTTTDIEMIKEFELRNIVCSPSILQTHLETAAGPIESNLELIQSAGAHLNQKLAARASNYFQADVINLYGSTEAGIFAQKNALTGDPLLAGTILPGATVEVLADTGERVSNGTEGEIRVRTSFQASGYLGDPEAYSVLYRDGWFYPKDRGFLSSNGQLHITGRTDDLINFGGLKIDPLPIEQLALETLDISDCGCFLATKEDGTSVFVMLVVSNSNIDTEVIRKLLNKKFGYAAPELIIHGKQVPRNENGKILRKAQVAIS